MSGGASGSKHALDPRGLPIGYPFKPDWEITPREVKRMLAEHRGFILLDCRNPDEYDTAKIEGSRLIPMGEVERRADELEDDDGGKATPIVVHCHHGMRSLRVAALLRAIGFADVRSMAGGIDLWSIDTDPSVPRY